MNRLILCALFVLVTGSGVLSSTRGQPSGSELSFTRKAIRHAIVEANRRQRTNFCQGCRSMLSFAQEFNSTETRDENKELFKNFCELYYPVSTDFQQGPCPMFVEALFYALDHTDPIRHCDQIGACQVEVPDYVKSEKKLPTRKSAAVCDFCEHIVDGIRVSLLDEKTVEMVRQYVNEFCDYLKVVGKEEQCKQMLLKNLDKFLEFVKQINPQSYCKAVQLCDAEQNRLPRIDSTSSSATLADFNNFGLETSVSVGQQRRRVAADEDLAKTSHRRGPNCAICKALVSEMFKFLRNNKTEANIVDGLNQVCKFVFPHNVQELSECQSMVKAYTREMIQLLMDETDPQLICMLLDQCVFEPQLAPTSRPRLLLGELAKSDDFDLGDLIVALEPQISQNSAKICIECKLFIAYLRDAIENPKTQQDIKDWLKLNLCENLPVDLRESCTKMVDQYAETLLKAIIGDAKPGEACAALGACTRKRLHTLVIDNLALAPAQKDEQQVSLKQNQKPPVGGSICDECVAVVGSLDEYLRSHSIDDDVSVLIDQVCNKMPNEKTRSTCVSVVEMLGVQIAHAIAQMDSPQQLCSSIMLCSAA